MYRVSVRDHMMVAHSLRGEVFGPAQRLHGATYVVDAVFAGPALGPDGVLVDIGAASALLHEVLGELTYRNLDDEPAFDDINTSTEVLARTVAERVAERMPGLGPVTSLSVTLHESHVAWASFELDL